MASWSRAAVLAQELAFSDSRLVTYALDRYESRRRKRVDPLQQQSRLLTWTVRARGAFAPVRDYAFRVTSPRMLLGAFSPVLSGSY